MTISCHILVLSGLYRTSPDLCPEVQQIFKIRTVQKPAFPFPDARLLKIEKKSKNSKKNFIIFFVIYMVKCLEEM